MEKAAELTSPEPFYEVALGGTLGGPIKKDKSFFFLSYQWDRLSDNLTDVFPVLGNYPATAADATALKGLPTTPGLQAYLATPSVSFVPSQTASPCFRTPVTPAPMPPISYRTTNPCLGTGTMLNNTPVGVAGLFPATQTVNYNVWNVPNANSFNLRDHEVSGRYDQRLNNSNDFYTRYLFDDLASPQAILQSPGVAAFGDLGLLPDYRNFFRQRTQSALVDHRYYRVNALNEFRISYSRVSQSAGAFHAPSSTLNNASAIVADCFASSGTPGCTPNVLGELGGQGFQAGNSFQNAGLFPSAGSNITIGQQTSPSNITSNTYQIQDNYSYTAGRHSLKFGVNFVKIDTNVASMPGNLGFYLYNGGFTGNGFQDLITSPTGFTNVLNNPVTSLAGVVSQRLTNIRTDATGLINGLGPNEVKIKEFDQFYFAQDDWRLKDNLTLSLGFRYENFGQPINSIHDLNKLAPLVNTDNKDFAPRLGFAWSPAKDWVVRGGYGIMYDPPILNIPLLIWQSGPVSPQFTTDNFGLSQLQPTGAYPASPLTVADFQGTSTPAFGGGLSAPNGFVQGCSQYFDLFDSVVGLPQSPSRAFNPFAVNGLGLPVPATIPAQNCANQNTVAKNLKNPYLQEWSLGVQRQLGANYLFELNYVGSKGSRLFQRVDLNPFQGWNSDCVANLATQYFNNGIGNLAVPGQCRWNRIDDTHGDITEVTNGGSSTYHALQAGLTKRWSRQKYFGDYAFNIAYTWSHLIDNTSEIFGPSFITLAPGDVQPFNFASASAIPVAMLFDPLANVPSESITPLAQTFNSTTDNERGNSSFDRRHRFVTSFLWEPFPTRNEWLRGWQLNGIYTYQSGQPFSPLNAAPLNNCADTNGDGSLSNDRPDIGNPHLPTSSVALIDLAFDPHCLATSAGGTQVYDIYRNGVLVNSTPVTLAQAMKMAHFVQRPLFAPAVIPGLTPGGPVPAGYGGDAGRNILTGPPINNLDLSIYRNLKLNERFTLQIRAEAYDVLNHPSLAFFNGSPYISSAAGAPAFAYAVTRTGAAITGGIPENAVDAVDQVTGNHTFLSKSNLNTSSRRFQFGLKLIF